MTFIDFNFYILLIVILLFYYLIPKKYQWVSLLIGSILFYFTFTKWYFLILFASIIISHFTAQLMQKKTEERKLYLKEHKEEMSREEQKEYKQIVKKNRKKICTIGVILNLSLLIFFKYTGFFVETMGQIMRHQFSIMQIAVPIGISYYIFRSTGYMIDVYRETYEAEKNPFKYALFVSYFPAILMGPLGRFNKEKDQFFVEHAFCYDNFLLGVQRIMWGFFKKMVIADRFAKYVNGVFDQYTEHGGFQIALTVLLFAIQEYADFSGFMDIALGISKLFGIELEENFQNPFMSANVGEFWRRWHITMGAWFRDYVFYEVVCGKFCKKVAKSKKISNYWKQAIPVIVGNAAVWILIGFWHGASWHHVFWGIYNGILIIGAFLLKDVFVGINKVLHIRTEALDFKIFQRVRTFILFAIGEVFFTADTLSESFAVAMRIVTKPAIGSSIKAIMSYVGSYSIDALAGAMGAGVLILVEILQYNRVELGKLVLEQHLITRWVLYLLCIFSIILLGIYGLDNASAFIYMGI